MRDLAKAIAVEVREDRVASWRDLNTRYAGLISGSRALAGVARAGGIAFSALGILITGLGALGISFGIVMRTPAAVAVAALLLLPLGMASIHVARELRHGVGHRRGSKHEQANGARWR